MDMKVSPRLRAGCSLEIAQQRETPRLIVRVRSGSRVGVGGFIGDEKAPTAFVWQDDEGAAPARELVVHARKGAGYLWEGPRPVTLKTLFPDRKALHALDNRFADWQRYFEKHYQPRMPQKFWWGRYHQEGIQLARQLQAELIDEAVVRYLRPEQDPQFRYAPEIAL